MCNYLGGNKINVNVCLFSDPIISYDLTHKFIPENDKKDLLSASFPMRDYLSKRSNEYGIRLLLEPLNRYSTPFCANLEDSLFVVNNCVNLG